MQINENENREINKFDFFILLRMTFKLYGIKICVDLLISILQRTVSFLSNAYLLGYVINSLQEQRPVYQIFSFIALIAFLTVISTSANIIYMRYFRQVFEKNADATLRKMLHERALQSDLSIYESPEMYSLYGRAASGGAGALVKMSNSISVIASSIYSAVLAAYFAIKIDPVILLFSVPTIIIGVKRSKDLQKDQHEIDIKSGEIARRQDYARRVFYQKEFAKEVRLSNISKVIFGYMKKSARDFETLLRKGNLRLELKRFLYNFPTNRLFPTLSQVYLAYRIVISHSMPVGDFFIANSAISQFSTGVNGVLSHISDIYGLCYKFRDFRAFFEHEDKISKNENGMKAHAGDIVLHNVSFRYEGADQDAIRGVELSIKSGERIAVVGNNGAGKTTLVKLLMRLYDPDSGNILLNGINIKDYQLDSYRSCFGTVFQDYKPLAFSVAENVLCKPYEDRLEGTVVAALKKSGLWEKVSALPSGIDTPLTREFDEDGIVLSGGESQKLAIAGIYARNCPIVILDEPSSALDPIAEKEMYRIMYRACEGKTMIFISHRLSSATEADRVLLMENGQIVEQGSHTELMQLDGRYAEMFRKQAEAYYL